MVHPGATVRDLTTVAVKSIRLKLLPLEVNIAAQAADKTLSEMEPSDRMQYRTSIVFAFDSDATTVTYTLHKPVFVRRPACQPLPKATPDF
jgi:PIN domain nuclease of toxin-antitoxin system